MHDPCAARAPHSKRHLKLCYRIHVSGQEWQLQLEVVAQLCAEVYITSRCDLAMLWNQQNIVKAIAWCVSEMHYDTNIPQDALASNPTR